MTDQIKAASKKHCRGEMKLGTTPFHIDRKGYHVTLDEVPAWVCEQCGESYFEEKDVTAMQALRFRPTCPCQG